MTEPTEAQVLAAAKAEWAQSLTVAHKYYDSETLSRCVAWDLLAEDFRSDLLECARAGLRAALAHP